MHYYFKRKYYFIDKFDTNNIDKLDNQTTVVYRNYLSKNQRDKENLLLKERQEKEVSEKFKIKEKNQKVQTKVEGIINRLRSLEYTQ